MEIKTTRFGTIEVGGDELIHFPNKIWGLEGCTDWVLLADTQNEALGWLQSVTRAEIALAVVSPRRFAPDYQVRIARGELSPIALDRTEDAEVLVIVNRNAETISLNLKAPLVLNVKRRLGCQVINNADQPLHYDLSSSTLPTQKNVA